MKNVLYWGSILLLLAAIGAMSIRRGPVPPAEPVRLDWPPCPSPPPPVELHSLRTMHETAFFKVIGVLRNRGVEPVGPVMARGRFTSGSTGIETAATAFTTPEIIVPGAVARFELIVPEEPQTVRVSIDFRQLTGKPIPVDGSHAAVEGKVAP